MKRCEDASHSQLRKRSRVQHFPPRRVGSAKFREDACFCFAKSRETAGECGASSRRFNTLSLHCDHWQGVRGEIRMIKHDAIAIEARIMFERNAATAFEDNEFDPRFRTILSHRCETGARRCRNRSLDSRGANHFNVSGGSNLLTT
jgi:hypothetical protein